MRFCAQSTAVSKSFHPSALAAAAVLSWKKKNTRRAGMTKSLKPFSCSRVILEEEEHATGGHDKVTKAFFTRVIITDNRVRPSRNGGDNVAINQHNCGW